MTKQYIPPDPSLRLRLRSGWQCNSQDDRKTQSGSVMTGKSRSAALWHDSADQQGYDRKIVFEDIFKDFQGTVYLVIDSASGNHEHLAYFHIGHSVKAFCHEYLICEIGHSASAFFKECGKVCLEFLLRALYSQPFYFNANPFLAPFILIQFTFLLLPFQIIDTPVFNGGGKERPVVRHILAVFCLDKLEYALRKYLFRTWIIPDITVSKSYISDLFLI